MTIRARIALGTFLVLALVLAGTGLVVDDLVVGGARASLDARLLSEAEAFAAATQFDGRRVEVELEGGVPTPFTRPGAYFQVSTAKRLVARSPSLAEASLPAADFERPQVHATIAGPNEPELRVVTIIVTRAPDEDETPAPPLKIAVQVARRPEEVVEARARVRSALAVALPLALFVGTLGAFAIAWRATRPIVRLGREARAIGVAGEGRIDGERIEGDLRDLALALNEAFERLSGALARERRFSADAAHELRTPLAVLRARLDLALSKDREAPEYREALRVALEACQRLESVVADLLLLARAGTSVARERVALAPIVKRLEGVRVTVADEPTVLGSAPLLERLVGNLVENARQHGGSDVEVTLRRGEIVVADRGPGFPEELLPRLFERFARGDASRSRATGGNGLGLAIVRTIARAHGGDVTAANREGGGAVVRVTLPDASM